MNKKRRLLKASLTSCFILLFCFCVYAQQMVRGTLRSSTCEPLIGATVEVKGTNRTAVTDSAGQFQIAADPGSTLVVSSVCYQTREINVTGAAEINEVLQLTDATLNVVVIGYQTVRRKDLTGAVGLINPEQNVANTVAESIQGLTPGVTVRNPGVPGGAAKIDIRGAGTFAANNPLYIIDGMYSDATPDFNPQDIESIQILKDASAAAIYCSRTANGVIIITTKQSRQGPLRFNGGIKYGIQNLHERWDMMNADEYRDLVTRLCQAGNLDVPTSLTTEWDPSINTDWQEEFLRQGAIGEYNLGVLGSINLRPLSVVRPGRNQAQFQQQIEHERITELTGEALRWNDLARWGYFDDPAKLAILQARDPEFANFQIPRNKYAPIPQSEIDINPNLVQNQGWGL